MQPRTRIILPLAIVVAMIATAGIRVLWGARLEYRRAQVAGESGDVHAAVVHYQRSLHWYFPGNPLRERALKALWEIGEKAEASSDPALALEAYRAIRNSIYATRSIYVPNRDWLEAANRRIARLEVSDDSAAWPDPALSASERFQVALETLSKDPAPSPVWSAVSIAGLFGWLAAFVGLVWKGFDAEGRVKRGPVALWAVGFLVAYAVWVLGLALA